MEHSSLFHTTSLVRPRISCHLKNTLRILTLAGTILIADPTETYALLEGAKVTAGTASIATKGTTQTVTQKSLRAVIDAKSGNIHSGEVLHFNHTLKNSATLARINDVSPTQIRGTISGNDPSSKVYMINPHGFIYGQGANVNALSLITSTIGIKEGDFMKGKIQHLNQPSPHDHAAIVIEEGAHVTFSGGGLAAFVAPAIKNSGIIEAKKGTVALAAGKTAYLDFHGDGLIGVAVTTPVDQLPKDPVTGKTPEALIHQTKPGKIIADGGKVILTAKAAQGVIDQVINIDGTIQAQTVKKQGDVIVLGGGGKVDISNANIDVSGQLAGQKGGTIHVLGKEILTSKETNLNADGDTGGGTILVGGDYQGGKHDPKGRNVYETTQKINKKKKEYGQGTNIRYKEVEPGVDLITNDIKIRKGKVNGKEQNIEYINFDGASTPTTGYIPKADTVTIEQGTKISAKAITKGDGGKIILWANKEMNFTNGILNASGGNESGHGGFIEISGKKNDKGKKGLNLILEKGVGEILTKAKKGISGMTLFDADETIGVVEAAALVTTLDGGNAFFTATGALTIAADIINLTTPNTLTLSGRSVTQSAGVDITLPLGDLTVNYNIPGADSPGTAFFDSAAGSTVTTSAATFSILRGAGTAGVTEIDNTINGTRSGGFVLSTGNVNTTLYNGVSGAGATIIMVGGTGATLTLGNDVDLDGDTFISFPTLEGGGNNLTVNGDLTRSSLTLTPVTNNVDQFNVTQLYSVPGGDANTENTNFFAAAGGVTVGTNGSLTANTTDGSVSATLTVGTNSSFTMNATNTFFVPDSIDYLDNALANYNAGTFNPSLAALIAAQSGSLLANAFANTVRIWPPVSPPVVVTGAGVAPVTLVPLNDIDRWRTQAAYIFSGPTGTLPLDSGTTGLISIQPGAPGTLPFVPQTGVTLGGLPLPPIVHDAPIGDETGPVLNLDPDSSNTFLPAGGLRSGGVENTDGSMQLEPEPPATSRPTLIETLEEPQLFTVPIGAGSSDFQPFEQPRGIEAFISLFFPTERRIGSELRPEDLERRLVGDEPSQTGSEPPSISDQLRSELQRLQIDTSRLTVPQDAGQIVPGPQERVGLGGADVVIPGEEVGQPTEPSLAQQLQSQLQQMRIETMLTAPDLTASDLENIAKLLEPLGIQLNTQNFLTANQLLRSNQAELEIVGGQIALVSLGGAIILRENQIFTRPQTFTSSVVQQPRGGQVPGQGSQTSRLNIFGGQFDEQALLRLQEGERRILQEAQAAEQRRIGQEQALELLQNIPGPIKNILNKFNQNQRLNPIEKRILDNFMQANQAALQNLPDNLPDNANLNQTEFDALKLIASLEGAQWGKGFLYDE